MTALLENSVLFTHHYLGDDVQDLLVATATACGAVGHFLHVLECGEDIFKFAMCMKRVGYVVVAYLLTVAYHINFLHFICLRNGLYVIN